MLVRSLCAAIALSVFVLSDGWAADVNSSQLAVMRAAKPFVVTDANGKVIGRLFGEQRVQLTVGGLTGVVDLIQFITYPSQIYIPTTKVVFQPEYAIFYGNADCSGPTYLSSVPVLNVTPPSVVPPPLGSLPAIVAKNTDGTTAVYVANGPASLSNIVSSYRSTANNLLCVFIPGADGSPGIPGSIFLPATRVDITGMYVEPFSIQ